VLCAFSIVLHTYALSLNSQQELLVRLPWQKACETMGITSLESVYRRNNVFLSCDADFLCHLFQLCGIPSSAIRT